jgi:hypothetical protein
MIRLCEGRIRGRGGHPAGAGHQLAWQFRSHHRWAGVVGHAGAALLRELADGLGLAVALGWRCPGPPPASGGSRAAGPGGDAGRRWRLRFRPGGAAGPAWPVRPSGFDPTAWRVLDRVAQDADGLARLRAARAHVHQPRRLPRPSAAAPAAPRPASATPKNAAHTTNSHRHGRHHTFMKAEARRYRDLAQDAGRPGVGTRPPDPLRGEVRKVVVGLADRWRDSAESGLRHGTVVQGLGGAS